VIGIDTNVLLRLATADDTAQVKKITQWLAKNAAEQALYINRVVLVEALWTLKSSYGYDKVSLAAFVEALLTNPVFILEDAELVDDALGMFEASKADFPDCLIFASNARYCDATLSLDQATRNLVNSVVL
jgi:predicted nucleic-acid-binding protein